MENEQQKVHRIACAMIAEMSGQDVITQISIIGTLLTSLTGSFVRQHPDEREELMKVLRVFFDDIRARCEQVAADAAAKSNHHAS